MPRKGARRKKVSRAGWRVAKGGTVYRAKGKTKSQRKTYKTKGAAKKAAKRKR